MENPPLRLSVCLSVICQILRYTAKSWNVRPLTVLYYQQPKCLSLIDAGLNYEIWDIQSLKTPAAHPSSIQRFRA